MAALTGPEGAAPIDAAVRAQFRAAGWIDAGASGLPKPAWDPFADDAGDFNSESGGLAAVSTGRRADIYTCGKAVEVSCIDPTRWQMNAREAMRNF